MDKPYLSIQEVADKMAEAGDKRTNTAINKDVYRALHAGTFKDKFQAGKGTAAWMVETQEALAWIAAERARADAAKWAAEQADKHDRIKRAWHLEEGRLADVAGLDE